MSRGNYDITPVDHQVDVELRTFYSRQIVSTFISLILKFNLAHHVVFNIFRLFF